MIEQAGALLGLLGKLLEVFQQKAFVYVDVSFGDEVPYRLTVSNESPFDILLLNLHVSPDGFPDSDNGLQLNDSSLFKNKLLKPRQRIKLLLRNTDIGEHAKRAFKIEYCTLIKGKKVPRLQQSCEHEFVRADHTVPVRKSLKVNYSIQGCNSEP